MNQYATMIRNLKSPEVMERLKDVQENPYPWSEVE
jgi:hypothetical protein